MPTLGEFVRGFAPNMSPKDLKGSFYMPKVMSNQTTLLRVRSPRQRPHKLMAENFTDLTRSILLAQDRLSFDVYPSIGLVKLTANSKPLVATLGISARVSLNRTGKALVTSSLYSLAI